MRRRDFIVRSAGSVGVLAVAPSALAAPGTRSRVEWRRLVENVTRHASNVQPAALANDEEFWAEVRTAFDLDPEVLNLDHGWTNPAPRAAVDAVIEGVRAMEALPAERIARLWPDVITTTAREALAAAMGVPGNEIAFVRNATEALNTVLLGLPLQRGDEVLCSAHDYYAMLDALEQRQARDGIVLRMVRPPIPATSLDTLGELYEQQINPRTRLVLLTHPSNLTGQLLPVQRIARAAHAAGAQVVVDGAQSLGLVEGSVADLDVDYYGASLHKWLAAPIGTGVLWMRPAHTSRVWPLVPPPPGSEGVGRFEWIGTAPDYVAAAAIPALELHASIGPARKAARLRYLHAHWRARIVDRIPQARFYTLPDEAMHAGLGTMELPGQDHDALQRRLREEHGILVQAMSGRLAPEVHGLRVSPNVYNTPSELDRVVSAMAALAG